MDASDLVTVILSQSDYMTDTILKTEKTDYAYLITILYYCIIKIKAMTDNGGHLKQFYNSQICLALTFTLWRNHCDEITL